MSITNVTVGAVPVQVSTSYGAAQSVLNNGPDTAYLSDQSSVNSNSYPLSVGSSVQWSQSALWVVSAGTSNIVASSDVTGTFDANAVASQLIAQGLAADIATDIYNTGIRAFSTPTTLLNISFTGNASPTTNLDVSNYATLNLHSSAASSSSSGTGLVTVIAWLDSDLHTVAPSESFGAWCSVLDVIGAAGGSYYSTPVKGAVAQVFTYVFFPANYDTGYLVVTGSLAPSADHRFVGASFQNDLAGIWSPMLDDSVLSTVVSGTPSGNGISTFNLASQNGPATFFVNTNAYPSGGAFVATLETGVSVTGVNRGIAQFTPNANGYSQMPLVLPTWPLQIQLQTKGSSGTYGAITVGLLVG